MKKLILLSLLVTLISCGKSKEEQMMFDYSKESMMSSISIDIEDLDYNIESISKTKDITVSDSLDYLKNELAKMWFPSSYSENDKDTLTFDYVIATCDTLKNTYQRILLMSDYNSYEYETKRDKYIRDQIEAESLKWRYDMYKSADQNDILCSVYKGTYSIKNPMLNNAKQSISKLFYTNNAGDKFVSSESL